MIKIFYSLFVGLLFLQSFLFSKENIPTYDYKIRVGEHISSSLFDKDSILPDKLKYIPGSLSPNYVKEHPYAARDVKPFYYKDDVQKDKNHAFLIGGVNSEQTLKKITQITGLPLEELESRMYGSGNKGMGIYIKDFDNFLHNNPTWKKTSYCLQRNSSTGFLAKSQKLRDVLIKDNRTVLSSGLTHQKVAAPLIQAIKQFEENQNNFVIKAKKEKALPKVILNGKEYLILPQYMVSIDAHPFSIEGFITDKPEYRSGWVGFGIQGSSFNDELFANWAFTLVDPKTKKRLAIDALTPHLIHRYGFYQGGPYRVAPEEIINFFGLSKKKK